MSSYLCSINQLKLNIMKSEQKLGMAMQMLNDLMQSSEGTAKKNMQEIQNLIHEFLTDNTIAKGAKRNIWDACTKDEVRATMTGVYHDESGYAVATDGRILIASKSEYNEHFKDKILDRYGKEIEGRYPNWKAALPNVDGDEEVMLPSDEDIARMGKEFAAYKKAMNLMGHNRTEKGLYVRLADMAWCDYNYLKQLRQWTDRVYVHKDTTFDTATNTKTEYVSRFYSETDDAKLLMMPVRELESRLDNLPKDALGVMWCGGIADKETKYILK